MKNKFLHTYRQQPPAEFSQTLKHRLDQMPEPLPQPKVQARSTWRLAQIAVGGIGFVLIVLLAPPVFAQVVSQIDGVIRQFGNVTVKEVETHPSILYAELVATNAAAMPSATNTAEPEPTEVANVIAETATPPTIPDDCTQLEPDRGQPILGPYEVPTEEPGVTIVPHECWDVETAIAQAGYEFSLPTLIPEGLWLESEVVVHSNEYGTSLTFFWRNENGNRPMHLDVSRAWQDNNVLLAPGTYEEIAVNGRPGIFIYGGWSGNAHSWNRDIVRTIRWEQDGVMYNLVGFQFQESFISDVMLKRIAGSIE